MARFAALAVLTALVVAVPALAWSSPSPTQRRAIVAAIRKEPAAAGVTRVERVRISTLDRRFASAVTFPRDKAGYVLARDSWLVRHYPNGWRVVFVGSDAPPCKVASAAVRRDLLGSAVCFRPALVSGAAGAAPAVRNPTVEERGAIRQAIFDSIAATGRPARPLITRIRVSSVTLPAGARRYRKFARVDLNDPKAGYAGALLGYYVTSISGWKVLDIGSSEVGCSVPAKLFGDRKSAILRDLALDCSGTNVVRVGVASETIGPWRVDANPSLAGAIAAFGTPSRCTKVSGLPGFASVEWRGLGLRAVFGTYGSGGARPCQATRSVRLDSARASSREWQTGRGLRVGDSVGKLRRLYPQATLRTYRRGVASVRGWWLVVRTNRVPDLHFVPTLLATAQAGRVTGFVVSVQAEGD
jgi:hypothetical protein